MLLFVFFLTHHSFGIRLLWHHSLNDYPFSDEDGDTTEECNLEGKNVTAFVDEPRIVVDFTDTYSFQERMLRMKRAVAYVPLAVTIKSNCRAFSITEKASLPTMTIALVAALAVSTMPSCWWGTMTTTTRLIGFWETHGTRTGEKMVMFAFLRSNLDAGACLACWDLVLVPWRALT